MMNTGMATSVYDNIWRGMLKVMGIVFLGQDWVIR
jgi:hypothetical protein